MCMYVFVFALLVVLYKNEREERKGGASSERGLCHTHAMRKNHARRRASIITANREEEQFKPSCAGKRTRRTHLKFKICIHAFASATKTPTTFFTRTQSPTKKNRKPQGRVRPGLARGRKERVGLVRWWMICGIFSRFCSVRNGRALGDGIKQLNFEYTSRRS